MCRAFALNTKQILLLAVLCFVAGCGEARFAGKYTSQIQMKNGTQENPKYPLDDARKKHQKNGARSIELKSTGRYRLETGNRIHEGDWWVEDNRIAIRCDIQNGQKLSKALISEGADRYFDIRNDGDFSRTYNSPDSNLEVVFSKQ